MHYWSVFFLHGNHQGPSDPAPACPTLYPRSSGQPRLGLSPGPHTPAGPRGQAERVSLAFLLTLATKRLEKTFPALIAAWELPGDATDSPAAVS